MPLLLGDEEMGRLDVVRVAGLVRMPAGVAHEVVALGLLAELERLDGARDRPSLDRVELAACLPGDRQELVAVSAEVREPFGGRARTPRRGRRRAGRVGQAPEAALAPPELRERCGQVGRLEVGPHAVGEMELGVRALPEEEVGQAPLAAGADQQIDVGHGRTVARRLRDHPAEELEVGRRGSRPAERGARDRLARGVVEGDAEMEPRAAARRALDAPDRPHDRRREAIAPPDDAHAQAVLHAARGLRAQVGAQEPHERRHLGAGPSPVVRGEREQREHPDAEPGRGLDDAPHGLRARAVPGGPGQSPARRPATVPVHHHGDVQRRARSGVQITLHYKVFREKIFTPARSPSPDPAEEPRRRGRWPPHRRPRSRGPRDSRGSAGAPRP